MTSHWEDTALPILEYCVSRVAANEDPPRPPQIAQHLELDPETVRTALILLKDEGYITTVDAMGAPAVGITKVHSTAFRAVGQWPSSNNEVFGNAMVETLEKLAAGERDEEKSAALQAAASDLRSIGVNGAGQVLGSFLKGIVGLA